MTGLTISLPNLKLLSVSYPVFCVRVRKRIKDSMGGHFYLKDAITEE